MFVCRHDGPLLNDSLICTFKTADHIWGPKCTRPYLDGQCSDRDMRPSAGKVFIRPLSSYRVFMCQAPRVESWTSGVHKTMYYDICTRPYLDGQCSDRDMRPSAGKVFIRPLSPCRFFMCQAPRVQLWTWGVHGTLNHSKQLGKWLVFERPFIWAIIC
jgi:hypothetical protein